MGAVAGAQVPAAQQRAAARRFLARRGLVSRTAPSAVAEQTRNTSSNPQSAARLLAEARSASARRLAGQHATNGLTAHLQAQLPAGLKTTWMPLGPSQTITPAYGAITGRVTSIAVDASDATGNTVYAGTTGGGVWKSINAAGPAGQVAFVPVTDDATPSATGTGSLSIGAVSVQPGGSVVLAGTGDPNDALDSYYGSGILRSTDRGATWTTITNANVGDYTIGQSFSFYGEGFSGFAWSTVTANLVVAAVTQAYDGAVVNALQSNSVDGLYFSQDAGATWKMATMTDGPNEVIQSPTTTTSGAQGNAVTSLVWNPFRRAFYAAVRYHGYYSSPDGMTWTRLANQPGINLSPVLCPDFASTQGAASCPIFRGALAVQPQTGDMFAITVDGNLADQGIWRDVCAASGGSCSTGTTVMFGTQVPDAELEDRLAAVPAAADTLLYVGTVDIFKRSLAASNVPWRNTTNVATCIASQVAPAQHAVATGTSAGLMYFGNDGGLWRTTDGIDQQQPACSADDAAHFENLNGALGSLAEVTSIAQSPGSDSTLLVGLGVNGSAGTTTEQEGWPQVLDGLGAYAAIDAANVDEWFVSSGPGVSISSCDHGGACDAAGFAGQWAIGDEQTDNDGESLGEPAVWMVDPQDATKMIVGTCRVWRGGVPGGTTSLAEAAMSPVMGDVEAPDCSEGEGQIQSLGGSGSIAGTGQEVLYAGMEGTPRGGDALPYGGLVAGHVFTATVAAAQSAVADWRDTFASPVVNDASNRGQFNPGGFGISSVVVDTHDTSGQTVYATVQGFSGNGISEPLVYRSANQGQSWTNITANLPITPVNALVVDPGNANIVYLATDAGVYATLSVAACSTGTQQCWSPYGIGLPGAPVTTLVADGAANDSLLVAGTYGRGVWEMLLASAQSTGAQGTTSAQLSPSLLTFAGQAVGSESAATAVTLTNDGPLALVVSGIEVNGDFSESDNCSGVTLAVGGTCTLHVAFAPTVQGARSGLLTVLANVPGGQVIANLAGAGGPAGQILLTPLQMTFPPTLVGNKAAVQYLTVSNIGSAAVSLQAPASTKDYQVSNSSCTTSVAGQTGCTVGIIFAPTISGADNGTFSIATGAGVFHAQLTGSGQKPATDALSATSLSFAAQVVGTASAAKTITITNSGDEPLTLITAASSLSDYQVNASACATNVPGHQSCAISVVFAPVTPGARTGKLIISDSLHAGTSSLTVALNGNGLAPSGISLLPASFDFGAQGTGSTSNAQTFTLTNQSGADLTGLSFAAAGNFAVKAGTCVGTLGAGKSCGLTATFTPSATGSRTGAMNVYATELATDLTTALSGIGLSFSLGVPTPATQTVVTGTAATYQVSIITLGGGYPTGALATLALACAGADSLPAGSSCVANPSSLAITSDATASVTVTVMTPALATTSSRGQGDSRVSAWAIAFALPFFSFFRVRFRKGFAGTAMLAVGLACTVVLSGCGVTASGGSKTKGTGTTGTGTPSTYVLTLTASSPGVHQSTQMTLVLEQ
jgi:hypothetical protein